jgi:AmmeMemoRadiSam system protein B
LVVGEVTPAQVAEVLDHLWGCDETLLVISSDLSHFLSYNAAREQDARTTYAMEQLDWRIEGDQACGFHALNGLLYCAAQRGMQVRTLALQNSGDTAGDKQRVVGYGAYAVYCHSPRRMQISPGNASC